MKRRTSRALHLGTKSGAGLRPTPCAPSSARVAATSGAGAPFSASLRCYQSREQRKPSSPARVLTRKDTHKREGNFGSNAWVVVVLWLLWWLLCCCRYCCIRCVLSLLPSMPFWPFMYHRSRRLFPCDTSQTLLARVNDFTASTIIPYVPKLLSLSAKCSATALLSIPAVTVAWGPSATFGLRGL